MIKVVCHLRNERETIRTAEWTQVETQLHSDTWLWKKFHLRTTGKKQFQYVLLGKLIVNTQKVEMYLQLSP